MKYAMRPPAIQRTSVRPKDLLYLRTLEDVMKIPEPMIPLMTRAMAVVALNSFLKVIFLVEEHEEGDWGHQRL